jgi:hypothetical protein
MAAGSPILLCNADDIIEESWTTRLVNATQHCDLVGDQTVSTRLEIDELDKRRPSLHHPLTLPPVAKRFAFASGHATAVRRHVPED